MFFLTAIFISLLFNVSAHALVLKDIAPKDVQFLRQKMPELWTQRPRQSDLDSAIRWIMKHGKYDLVSAEKLPSGEYAIVGRPLSLIEAVVFDGNTSFVDADLLTASKLTVGERFDRKKAVAAGQELKKFYGESGYFNTVIQLTFEKQPQSPNDVILHFKINEKNPCRIAAIRLNTDNAKLKRRLTRYLDGFLKKTLTEERLNALLKEANKYFIDNRYLTADISQPAVTYNDPKTKAYLEFEIKTPDQYEFFLSGNKQLEHYDIFKALDLENYERKNIDPASEGADRIKRYYLSKGYPNIQIDYNVRDIAGEDLKKVYFHIDEGFLVRIRRIEVDGRISRMPSYYSRFVRQNSTPLIAKGYYNRQDLDEGYKNLITELRNQGYLKARIQSSRIEYSKDKKTAKIVLLLDEGPLTQIRLVEFTGDKSFSPLELSKVIGLETNSPLRLDRLEAGVKELKNFYHDHGFLEMKLLNENEDLVQYNAQNTQARITFKIFEGPQVKVAAIHVEGNSFTKTPVILKEAEIPIGEILTPKEIDDAVARLNKMSLFSRVDIHTLEDGTNVANRTVIIDVTERDPGVFRFGAGINDERQLTARGFIGMSYNNLWGTARAISARAQVNYNVAQINFPETEVTAGYLEPFLFNTRTRGRVNLTSSQYVYNYVSKNGVTQITNSNKIDFLLERDLSTHTRFSWELWGYNSERDYERHQRCEDGVTHCSPTTQYIATIGPILDVDYRDSPFLPTKGSYTRLSATYSDPRLGSSETVNFFKAEFQHTYYLRLGSPKWVWANSVRGGYVANVSGHEGSGVPRSEAFFLGGIYTVRGFDAAEPNERIPPDWELPLDITNNQLIFNQDSHYYLVKSELRFPIYGAHGGVIFYDGGLVQVTGHHFDRPYRDSVGIGYRYNTPVGPVALDLAFKINPRRSGAHTEKAFRLHFSIGTF